MKLLPNERKIVSSNGDTIVLTDHRIWMTDTEFGQSYSIGIFLEHISSIEIKYKSNVRLLFLAGIALIGGCFGQAIIQPNNFFVFGLIVAVICVGIWWYTRKHVVSIQPDGGVSLDFMVQGMRDEQINDFVHKVFEAQQARMKVLYKIE